MPCSQPITIKQFSQLFITYNYVILSYCLSILILFFIYFFRVLLLVWLSCLWLQRYLCCALETSWINPFPTGDRCIITNRLSNKKPGFTSCWHLLLLCWWQEYFENIRFCPNVTKSVLFIRRYWRSVLSVYLGYV